MNHKFTFKDDTDEYVIDMRDMTVMQVESKNCWSIRIENGRMEWFATNRMWRGFSQLAQDAYQEYIADLEVDKMLREE